MIESTIFSIGHGQKSEEEFIDELLSFNIAYLIDVRTSPYSKWAAIYNRECIEQILTPRNIRYLYMGDVIGGRPLDDSCYDDEGYFDYKKMAEVPSFKLGLKRLVVANEHGCRVAIMCSESDPSQCHRSKLIGRELYFNNQICVSHIVGVNRTISQRAIMEELDRNRGDWPNGNLLVADPLPPYFKSRKSYKKEEINEDSEYFSVYD